MALRNWEKYVTDYWECENAILSFNLNPHHTPFVAPMVMIICWFLLITVYTYVYNYIYIYHTKRGKREREGEKGRQKGGERDRERGRYWKYHSNGPNDLLYPDYPVYERRELTWIKPLFFAGTFHWGNPLKGLGFASQPVLGTWSTRIPIKLTFWDVYSIERKDVSATCFMWSVSNFMV